MDIDFIITWVDGNDPKWQKEKGMYSTSGDCRDRRYRSWDNLQYLFRGIERFAPWVNKVYLVTCGHYPDWLNLDHPKLELVKHSDFIPDKWLPTFSSRAIDTNFHRIKQLSEHFVYFNDDMFLINEVSPEVFFKKGLPCDSANMWVWPSMILDTNGPLWLAPLHDIVIINQSFSKADVIRRNWRKWFSLSYGKYLFSNLYLLPHKIFTGFVDYHLPYSYLKSTIREVWEKEGAKLEETCSHKFREDNDLNHWLFTYWQFATGRFYPRSPGIGKKIIINRNSINTVVDTIKKKKYKMICINDKAEDDDFEMLKKQLNQALNTILPDKSEFEK